VSILELNAEATKSGKGAFGLEGEGGSKTMIDAPVVRQLPPFFSSLGFLEH
jgi:hypothetical protein